MDIPKNILKVLKANHWDEFNYELSKDSYVNKIRKMYSKCDYPLTDTLVEKLSVFYNTKIRKDRDNFHYYFYLCYKHIANISTRFINECVANCNVSKMLVLGDITQYADVVLLDEQENVWVVGDTKLYYYASDGDIFNGIEKLFSGQYNKEISVSNEAG